MAAKPRRPKLTPEEIEAFRKAASLADELPEIEVMKGFADLFLYNFNLPKSRDTGLPTDKLPNSTKIPNRRLRLILGFYIPELDIAALFPG